MSETSSGLLRESQSMKPIGYKEIERMIGDYQDGISNDTTSAWVSIYDLMALISDNKANGIRLYFGRHPKDDAQYPGRHNVIFVATRDTTDFENPTTQNSVDLLNKDKVEVTERESFEGQGGDAIPLCKPNCPTSSF
jgi:hypothetical protein